MSLSTPESVQKLQTALHDKAKEAPNFRFYALYDKVYRKDVLAFAYECCKANGGAAGVDGQTFEDIEAYGNERWLDELAQELKNRTYQPLPVRRVYIPKPDGKQRPLGVPAIRDRTAEMAAVLVLEPIFEADLQPEQYAYRPDRSALDAVRHVHKLINTGHGEIVDADLSSYFKTVHVRRTTNKSVSYSSFVRYRVLIGGSAHAGVDDSTPRSGAIGPRKRGFPSIVKVGIHTSSPDGNWVFEICDPKRRPGHARMLCGYQLKPIGKGHRTALLRLYTSLINSEMLRPKPLAMR